MDFFESLYNEYHPGFSTFLLNSIAHLQHSFWRFIEPEKFNVNVDSKEYHEHKNTMFLAYKNMDALIGRFFRIIGDDANLALATGLSQQEFIKDGDSQVYYRLKDVNSFVKKLGFKDFSISQVMTHQYIFQDNDKSIIDEFCSMLDLITLSTGAKVFDYSITSNGSVCFGTYLTKEIEEDEKVLVNDLKFDFADILYRINESKSGSHNPDGTFWIMSEKVSQRCPELAITDVNAIIKQYFNVAD